MPAEENKPVCIVLECEANPTRGKKTCKEHSNFFNRVRQELEENPMLIYNQRSDNPNRTLIDKDTGKRRKSKGKSLPVCCVPGCFELRVPPDPYCDTHQDYAGGD
jgi:hypothetical protein